MSHCPPLSSIPVPLLVLLGTFITAVCGCPSKPPQNHTQPPDRIIYIEEIPTPSPPPQPPSEPTSLPHNATFPDRLSHTITLCGHHLWILGGYTQSPQRRGPLNHPILLSKTAQTHTPTSLPPKPTRWGHTTTCLPNTHLFLLGGSQDNPELSPFSIAPPTLLSSTSSAQTLPHTPKHTNRIRHTATLLPNGSIFVAGGLRTSEHTLSSTSLYNTKTHTWSPSTPNLHTPRFDHTATLLQDGRVLLVGGRTGSGCQGTCVADCLEDEDCHDPALCSDEYFCTQPHHLAEIYDPKTNTLSLSPTEIPDARTGHTATLLPNGHVLVVGGSNTSTTAPPRPLLFQPPHNLWTLAPDHPTAQRSEHTATPLPNGHVLIVGGVLSKPHNPPPEDAKRSDRIPTSSCSIYRPLDRSWHTCKPMRYARRKHRAHILSNGQVLIWGGVQTQGHTLLHQELYDPKTDTWTLSTPIR